HAARVADEEVDLAPGERVAALLQVLHQRALHVDAARGQRAGLDRHEAKTNRRGLCLYKRTISKKRKSACSLHEPSAVEAHVLSSSFSFSKNCSLVITQPRQRATFCRPSSCRSSPYMLATQSERTTTR